MYELPGEVFVSGQLLPAQLQALKEQGVQSIINNRPDMEGPLQPLSVDMNRAAQDLAIDYSYIPMLGGLDADLIAESVAAYENMPRPIVAFCASGMRSTALWAFAYVHVIGVESVIKALENSPYNLAQIYPLLNDYEKKPKEND